MQDLFWQAKQRVHKLHLVFFTILASVWNHAARDLQLVCNVMHKTGPS